MERPFVNPQWQTTQQAQRGAGKAKALIYTFILIFGVYVAYKIVPPYVQEYQLKDKMAEQARFAIVNRYSDQQIKDNIMRTINDLDIPARPEDVKVANTGRGLEISVTYSVPLDLLIYKTELTFSPSAEGQDIMK